MKNKKLILVAVLAAAMVMLMACGLVSNVESIAFTKAPASTYQQGAEVNAKDFSVTIVVAGVSQEIYLNDSRLTVEGVVDGKLDTSSVGTKTLKVTYQGVSAQITYEVLATGTTTTWADENVTGEGKDLYNLINDAEAGSTVILQKDYDLADHQWKGLEISKNITIDGNGHKISNMTITDKAALSTVTIFWDKGTVAAGFISVVKNNAAVTVKGLTFENAKIDYVDSSETSVDKNLSKNYGVVIGVVSCGSSNTVTVENVTVKNAYVRGMGRLGGIIGLVNYQKSKSSATVKDCKVLNSTLVGVNPVTDASLDGEGDKIGGIVGHAGYLTVTGCTVLVQISGTRDLGGILGYAAGDDETASVTLTNNTVKLGSVIATSVAGSTTASGNNTIQLKNAGGILGTLNQKECHNLTIAGNTIEEDVTIGNTSVVGDSSNGDYVGGFYNDGTDYTCTINSTSVVIKANLADSCKIGDTEYTSYVAFIEALNKAIADYKA